MTAASIQGFNLSPQQKHLWSLQADGDAFYSRCVLTIEGQLTLDRLQAAMQRVIGKQEILRSTLIKPFGLKFPLQHVASPGLLDSPLRVELSTPSPRESVLCLRLPALFGDGRSILTIAEELGRAYVNHDSVAEEDAEFQYAQYAQWK